ncbi:hypothetical protein C8Q76DRAFT_692060 [Earliella scabrosa]|nr:hypothetical protein C8Q76DRAFT_692060 [Earliella scabrosa]
MQHQSLMVIPPLMVPPDCRGVAVGQGPGRTGHLHALSQMMCDPAFWIEQLRGGQKMPVFLDDTVTNSQHTAAWEAFSALCGIHLAVHTLGPVFISPFLILLALLSLFEPDTNLRFTAWLGAQDLATSLAPWIKLPWNEPIPSFHDQEHPARQFVIMVLEKNHLNSDEQLSSIVGKSILIKQIREKESG